MSTKKILKLNLAETEETNELVEDNNAKKVELKNEVSKDSGSLDDVNDDKIIIDSEDSQNQFKLDL